MPLTPQDVHTRVFGPTRFRRGYDEAEVDAFLDEVQVELTRLHREIDTLRSQLGFGSGTGGSASAGAGTAMGTGDSSAGTTAGEVQARATSLDKVDVAGSDGSGDLEQQVARTLVLAQRAADEALRDAEAQAETVRAAAQAEAERVRAEAAEAAARERSALETERGTAQDDVEQLRAFEREYRLRLRAYLELQLRELDGAGSGQVENRPAPALPADAVGDAPAPIPGDGGQVGSGASGPAHPTSSEPTDQAEQAYAGAYAAAPAPQWADSAAGGVSERTAGDEQGHEPPA